MTRAASLALTIACLLGAQAARAAPRTPLPTEPFDLTGSRTFSDVCLNAETANPYGLRVFLTPAGRTPRVAVQRAFGLFDPPVAGKLAGPPGRQTFTVKGATPATSYRGVITGDSARIATLEPDARTLTLALRDDTDGLPDCP